MDALKGEIVAQGELAFKALQKYQKQSEKKQLFPEQATSIFLSVKYKKTPLTRDVQRKLLELPCSDKNPSNSSICMILPDFDRSDAAKKDPDVDSQSRQWYEKLREKYGLREADIAKILTYVQLTREYSQVMDKVRLASTYDIFLVDGTLQQKVFSFLGAPFQKQASSLFPIRVDRQDLPKQIKKAYSLVNLPLDSLKDSLAIRIGNAGQKCSDLAKNLKYVIDQIFQHCHGGAKNIRSCYIMTSNTKVTLPIYVDFGSANEVKLRDSRKRVYKEVLDECSTLPEGLSVKVCEDGQVTVIDEKTKEEVVFPNMDDEYEPGDDLKPDKVQIERLIKEKASQLVKKEEGDVEAGKKERRAKKLKKTSMVA
ncbi:ribosomal protein l1p/L10e family domain-containing protein [Ditylenchus destructor]|nr:ribosomal protein l1p/L10e family domain-containing protein [Ditylenchus destructor]